MTEKLKTLLIVLLAVACFIIGVAGLFLPIIPGLVFIAFSLFLLSTRFSFVRRWLETLERKYPAVAEKVREWREKW